MSHLLVSVAIGFCLVVLIDVSHATFFHPPGFHPHMGPLMHPAIHHAMKKHHMMKKLRPMIGPHGFPMSPPVHVMTPMHPPPMMPVMKIRPVPVIRHNQGLVLAPDMIMMNKMLKKKMLAKARYRMPVQQNRVKQYTPQKKSQVKSKPGPKGKPPTNRPLPKISAPIKRTENPRPGNLSPSQYGFGPMKPLPISNIAKVRPVMVEIVAPVARVPVNTFIPMMERTFVGGGRYVMEPGVGIQHAKTLPENINMNRAIEGLAPVNAHVTNVQSGSQATANSLSAHHSTIDAAIAAAGAAVGTSNVKMTIPKPIPAAFKFQNGPVVADRRGNNVAVDSISPLNGSGHPQKSSSIAGLAGPSQAHLTGASHINDVLLMKGGASPVFNGRSGNTINQELYNMQLQDTLINLALTKDGTIKRRILPRAQGNQNLIAPDRMNSPNNNHHTDRKVRAQITSGTLPKGVDQMTVPRKVASHSAGKKNVGAGSRGVEATPNTPVIGESGPSNQINLDTNTIHKKVHIPAGVVQTQKLTGTDIYTLRKSPGTGIGQGKFPNTMPKTLGVDFIGGVSNTVPNGPKRQGVLYTDLAENVSTLKGNQSTRTEFIPDLTRKHAILEAKIPGVRSGSASEGRRNIGAFNTNFGRQRNSQSNGGSVVDVKTFKVSKGRQTDTNHVQQLQGAGHRPGTKQCFDTLGNRLRNCHV